MGSSDAKWQIARRLYQREFSVIDIFKFLDFIYFTPYYKNFVCVCLCFFIMGWAWKPIYSCGPYTYEQTRS